MYYEAELIFKSYKPKQLEIGMLFINQIVRSGQVGLFVLKEMPENEEQFIVTFGYPVELYIINPLEYSSPEILAIPEQIGWWDDGDDVEDLREITLEDINYIIDEFGGWVEIFMDDEGIEPLIVDDKVILRCLTEEE